MPFVRHFLERARQVLHFDDPPPRLALALAVGVFIGCTPLWGLQTLLAIAVAAIFRLNRAATVLGAWLNLPWIAPLVYAAAFKIGVLLLPDPTGTRSAWLALLLTRPASLSLADMIAMLPDVSLALLLGTGSVGLGAGAVTYVVALQVITRRRARHADRGGPHRRAA